MFRLSCSITLLALGLAAGASSQAPAARWTDPSSHTVRHLTVARGITLELLDWGGTGRAALLLAGVGHTAHVFDDFAPTLRACCHVYGLTRRGYGLSSRPSTGYDDQRLADDVLRAIDEAALERPILIGHSMAGGELTTLGRQHSERLGGLVYLDALGDREDDPLADAEWVRLQRQLPAGLLPQARCNPVDRSSFELFRRTSACERGFALPEAELRQMYEDRAGRVGPSRSPAWVGQAIGEGEVVRRDYANIRVPVLVLHNGAQTTEALLTASGYAPRTADERETIDRFVSRSREVFGRSVARLTRHVPDARIVYLPLAGHYLFLTRGTDVVQDIRAFASSLGSRRRD